MRARAKVYVNEVVTQMLQTILCIDWQSYS